MLARKAALIAALIAALKAALVAALIAALIAARTAVRIAARMAARVAARDRGAGSLVRAPLGLITCDGGPLLGLITCDSPGWLWHFLWDHHTPGSTRTAPAPWVAPRSRLGTGAEDLNSGALGALKTLSGSHPLLRSRTPNHPCSRCTGKLTECRGAPAMETLCKIRSTNGHGAGTRAMSIVPFLNLETIITIVQFTYL